jgi:hypothetical protein
MAPRSSLTKFYVFLFIKIQHLMRIKAFDTNCGQRPDHQLPKKHILVKLAFGQKCLGSGRRIVAVTG